MIPGLAKQGRHRVYALFLSFPKTASYQTSQQRHNHQIHELRIYSVYPQCMKAYIDLSTEMFHLRTAHSKLLGFWTTELGGLNEVVHIWEYDSLAHRASVRQALAKDPVWISEYLSKCQPMWSQQDNCVMTTLFQNWDQEFKEGGVYTLEALTAAPGKMVNFGKPDQTCLGAWWTNFGNMGKVHYLRRYDTVDEALKQHDEADVDVTQFQEYTRKLMLPTAWSPLK